MRLKSIIHATLAVAAAGALPGVWQGVALAQAAAIAMRALHGRRHPHRRPAAHLRRHGVQLPAGEHRRSARLSGASPKRCAPCTTPAFSATSRCVATAARWSIAVLERPSIESFEIKGNKDIKTEDLQKSLRNVGLATGKTFDQSVLDEVKQYLTDQYFSRGKYAVRVDTKVEEVPGNKVKVTIDVNEGKRARIRQINIAGNNAFSDEELQEEFELNTPNWLSWYKQDDRYARESLSGDLEKLRSYYMDRGYANFHVTSTQVAIAPEKDDIFVTVNVDEGEVFKISEIKIAGNMVVPESELRRLICFKPGDTYSLRQITAIHRSDEAAPGRRRLRVRDRRSGADAEQRHQGNLAHVRRRSEESRLRPPRQFQRHLGRQRRSVPSRNAPVRRRVPVELGGGALQAAYPAPAVHPEGRSGNQPGARHGRPGRRRLRDRGGPARPVRRRHRLLRIAVGHPERQLRALEFHGHRQPYRHGNQFRPLRQGVQLLAHRSVHHDR